MEVLTTDLTSAGGGLFHYIALELSGGQPLRAYAADTPRHALYRKELGGEEGERAPL